VSDTTHVAESAPAGERPPLVTIGIPAYNRPVEVQRAVRSALAQDYPTIEVLASDDASPDASVRRVLAALAAADARLRFVAQPRNLGHAANYQWLLDRARGEYFMWLSDDDWIDREYVSRCVAVLRADSGTALACGLARYYRGAEHAIDERPTNLTSARAGVRVVRYFASVSVNGPLFGVFRRAELLETGFPPVVGGDWMLIASTAARGRVRTLGDVHIHRSMSGLGSDASRLGDSFGLRGFAARHHHAFAAARIGKAIALGRGSFRSIDPVTRMLVAAASAGLILVRFSVLAMVPKIAGERASARLEGRISAWLRSRDSGP
jgi:hypothetical protein